MDIWRDSVDWLAKLDNKPRHRAMLEDQDIDPKLDIFERLAFAKIARKLPLHLRRDFYALLWRAQAMGQAMEARRNHNAIENQERNPMEKD